MPMWRVGISLAWNWEEGARHVGLHPPGCGEGGSCSWRDLEQLQRPVGVAAAHTALGRQGRVSGSREGGQGRKPSDTGSAGWARSLICKLDLRASMRHCFSNKGMDLQKRELWLGTVVHTCHPATQKRKQEDRNLGAAMDNLATPCLRIKNLTKGWKWSSAVKCSWVQSLVPKREKASFMMVRWHSGLTDAAPAVTVLVPVPLLFPSRVCLCRKVALIHFEPVRVDRHTGLGVAHGGWGPHVLTVGVSCSSELEWGAVRGQSGCHRR